MNIIGRTTKEKRIFCIVCAFIFILIMKYGSKYIYLYTHERECFVHYLRKTNFSQKIENVEEYSGSEELCDNYVQRHANSHHEIFADLKSLDSDKKYTQCIKTKFDKSDIKSDIAYVGYLILHERESKLSAQEAEHTNRSIEAVLKTEKLKMDVFFYDCHLEDQLKDEFEFLCHAAVKMIHPPKMNIADKCFAEYLKKNLEDYRHGEEYLNLPAVPAETCENEVVAPLKEFVGSAFYEQKAMKIFKNYPKFRECFIQKVVDVRLIDKMVIISMVAKFGMDEDIKNYEFNQFSQYIENFKKGLYNDCLKKNEYSYI